MSSCPFLIRHIDEYAPTPPDPLIGTIGKNEVVLDFGDSGVGKSFMEIDTACHVARDVGPVVYFAGEGMSGFRRRVQAWQTFHSVEKLRLYVADIPLFSSRDETDAAFAALADIATNEGVPLPPVLLVFDTFARCLDGADENDSGAIMRTLKGIDELRRPWSATAIIVHHSGHSSTNRARGSSAIRGAVDRERLIRRSKDGLIAITETKVRDGECAPTSFYCLEKVGDSAVIVPVSSVPNSNVFEQRRIGTGTNQTKALSLLTGFSTLPEWKAAMRENGIPAKRQGEVIASLLSSGAIVQEGEKVRRVS